MDCWAGESKDSQKGSRQRKKNAPAPEKTARYLVKSLGCSIYVWTIIPMSRFETLFFRFERTADMLAKSGLLEITMKTADLIRSNQQAQRELDQLKVFRLKI